MSLPISASNFADTALAAVPPLGKGPASAISSVAVPPAGNGIFSLDPVSLSAAASQLFSLVDVTASPSLSASAQGATSVLNQALSIVPPGAAGGVAAVGQFILAAQSAMQAQDGKVNELAAYGNAAATALQRLANAGAEADSAHAHEFQTLSV